jgi:uncharacterized protein (TIGR03435 family)
MGRYELTLECNIAAPPVEAARDQLGLILKQTKSQTDVLVVDHAEKTPTRK